MSPRPRRRAPPTPAAPRAIRCCSPPSRRNKSRPRPVSTARRFVLQAVDALGLGKTGDRKLAEVRPFALADPGESSRRYDGAMEPAGDFFQPRRQIDGGTDAGEIEPVAAADIAEQNFSDMQRHPEAKALDGFSDRIMHRIDTGAGFPRGLQHVAANLLRVLYRIRDRKNREEPVAHELQGFSARGRDRV